MTSVDQDYDGVTRPLSALDSVTLRYTSFPHIPNAPELVALAERSALFREEVLALLGILVDRDRSFRPIVTDDSGLS